MRENLLEIIRGESTILYIEETPLFLMVIFLDFLCGGRHPVDTYFAMSALWSVALVH